jgi:Tfp pilus assembly protein PilV
MLLQTRVKEQRKKAFDEAQRKALADASAALQAATAANGNGSSKKPEPSASASTAVGTAADELTAQDVAGALPGSGSSSPASAAAAGGSSGGSSKPGKAELEARVAYLQEAAKNYDDSGELEGSLFLFLFLGELFE